MHLPNIYKDKRVCIIGLGYVGLTLAVIMAEAGFEVLGIERDQSVVDRINNGFAHFSERGLDARLAAQVRTGRLRARSDWPAESVAEVYIITVGTPLGDGKTTNLEAIDRVASTLAAILKDDDMVILRSTVRIGVSRDVVKPVLDGAGKQYSLAFCPERTLEGKALEELRTLPQIFGGIDQDAAVRAAQLFAFITPTTIRVSSLETAEMIKLINNTQRDLMFAFANEVADICDTLGVSAIEVIRAGNMGYARASMPTPGPVGGPCLEKDPYILAEAVTHAQGRARLSLMGRQVNEDMTKIAAQRIGDLLGDRATKKIAIFGLAFKGRPETSDLRGTLAVKLITDLRNRFPGAEIWGYDPAVPVEDILSLGIMATATAQQAYRNADCVLFQNNNPAFEQMNLVEISEYMTEGGIFYDLWSQFDGTALPLVNNVRYAAYGSLCFATQNQ